MIMKTNLLKILPMSVLLLTGCFNKSISKEQFTEKLSEVKTHLLEQNSDITNVHMQTGLGVAVHYEYKEGEFYDYSSLGILGILSERNATWLEDGKYYHYHSSVGHRDAKVEEITKEQFDTYMAENKNTVITKLMEPVLEAELLNGEKPEQYLEVTNKYYEISKGFKLESKVKYQEPDKDDSSKMVDATKNYVFEFKNNLPTKYTYKTSNGSNTKYTYSYGNASFSKPTPSSDSSQA